MNGKAAKMLRKMKSTTKKDKRTWQRLTHEERTQVRNIWRNTRSNLTDCITNIT